MTTLPLAAARADFSRLVESAERTHERFEITRNGHRSAVLLGADDFDSLTETLEILSDPETMAAHAAGMADIEAGRVFSSEEVRAQLVALGRLDP